MCPQNFTANDGAHNGAFQKFINGVQEFASNAWDELQLNSPALAVVPGVGLIADLGEFEAAATIGLNSAFGKMGYLNGGSPIAQYFRIGVGRDGGQSVFRAAGEWVEKYVPSGLKTDDGRHIIFGRRGNL